MPRTQISQFRDGLQIGGVSTDLIHSGRVRYVSNNANTVPLGVVGNDGNSGKTPELPLATLAQALTMMKDNRGDVIVLMPGHAETISTSTALTIATAGVTILGLGTSGDRPVLTLSTATTATVNIQAANVRIVNCTFVSTIAALVGVFTLTNAPGFFFDGCRFTTSGSGTILAVAVTDTTSQHAAKITIAGNVFIDSGTGATSMLSMLGTTDSVTIIDNYVSLGVSNNKAALITAASGKSVTNLFMARNRVYRLNTDTTTGGILGALQGTSNSGIVCDNYVQDANTTTPLLVSAANCGVGCFQNFHSGALGTSGTLLP